MRYRLPLELELTVLELAAPPLAIDSLHDRVDFFINVSLVHRSLTAWAQDRLRDQFLYSYRPRPDEHARLKQLFEAGFGRDRPLRRLYLDCTRLPTLPGKRTEPGTDSVSFTYNGHVCGPISRARGPGGPEQAGTSAQEQACEAVASFEKAASQISSFGCWELCTMITDYSQALDTLWLKPPLMRLEIKNLPPPRLLYIDNGAFDNWWGWFSLLPLSSETVLAMRNIKLWAEGSERGYETRHMIVHRCSGTLSTVLNRFPRLETLVFFEPEVDNLGSVLNALPTPVRRVHILKRNFRISETRSDPPRVLPHLESFTYTSLSSYSPWVRASRMPTDDDPDADALADVQHAIESIISAPQCTFKYVRSTTSPEEALANALATFNL